ncbi:signal peptidase II [Cohnella candidum]|uniref:Lipoprotein signal peptidase n=1 Tax=Cohnella candidum TaxID=2674991 RepID=A0A3G3JYN5_9BACL|nr:signal peptidase II [Cohnella candidum]AYQ73355.1 signal peptidase II [Cohnella candidum]
MVFYAIVVLVVIVDQLSKILIRSNVDLGEYTRLGWLRITHYENSGMAGSMFPGYGWLFGIFAFAFVIWVLYFRWKSESKSLLLDISLGFLVGGAIGNGVDRLLFGQVTDFLVRSRGILNVADHAIEAGVLFFLAHSLTLLWKSRREAKAQ